MKRWLPSDIDIASLSERNRRAWAEQEAKRAAQTMSGVSDSSARDHARKPSPLTINATPAGQPGLRVKEPGTGAVRVKADSADRPKARSAAASNPPIYPLVGMCRAAGLPEPIPEYKFHPLRKWRGDYVWPIHKVIVEIDGGLFIQGRHSRGPGQLADMEKHNSAQLLGYHLLRYSPQQLPNAIRDLRIMFARSSDAV